MTATAAGVCGVCGFRHEYRPDLIGAVGGQPLEGFLTVAKGRTLNRQFEAASLHDLPGADKGGLPVLAFRGQPIPKAYYLAFHFPVLHGSMPPYLYSNKDYI